MTTSAKPADRNDQVLDRAFLALVLVQRGYDLKDVARALPSRVRGQRGVSVKSAAVIIRSGARSLLSSVIIGRPCAGLPEQLWPPRAVREYILEARVSSYRAMRARLRAWLEGRLERTHPP